MSQENRPVCPYADKSDPRCAHHWTLKDVASAFTHCADRYTECPAYLEMVAKDPRHVLSEFAFPMLAAS